MSVTQTVLIIKRGVTQRCMQVKKQLLVRLLHDMLLDNLVVVIGLQ